MNASRSLAVLPSASFPVTYSTLPDVYTHPGLSLSQIFSIVWAYRKLTIAIAAIVIAITCLVVALWPRTYTSTATLMVNYDVNDPLNGKEFPIGLLSSYMATQTELMRNPEVLLAVVDRLNLTQDDEYAAGYSGDSAGLREWVQKKISKNLTIYQGQFGSQLIYLTYAAHTPAEAARIANTVADVYKEQDFVRSTSPTTERAKRYAEQLEQLKSKVKQAQEQYTSYHQSNSLIDSGGKADVEIALLSDLEQQLIDAQRARRIAESRTSSDQDVGDQVMGSQLIQTLKTQLATQESRLAELQTTMGPRHPQVIELQSQLQASRRALSSEVNSYSRNAAGGLSATQQLEQKLQRSVAAQHEKVLNVSKLHDQAAKYRLELESAQAVYKRALDGYDQVMFASLGNYTNVSFVSRATPPVKASKPRVLVYLLLGTIAGCLLGLFAPLFYELTNRRVRCRDDLERDNGVPVLAEFQPLPMMRSTA
ncbi:MAG: hypothetical protein H7Y02_02880 [Candidatus Obscuribacterales bacterium]|nr:hypothetical protein [Steroidobacteraceae bacterium]